jgi:hypothetical protein
MELIMDEDLKNLWKSHRPGNGFSVDMKKLIDHYKIEEKKSIRSKIWASIALMLTSIYLIWLMFHYDWTSGIKMWGIILMVLDMMLMLFLYWFRDKPLDIAQTDSSSREVSQLMIDRLKDQILFNKYIQPLYGLVLTIGILMIYSDLVPRMTNNIYGQVGIYIGVISFMYVLIHMGISKKNRHIRRVIQPLIEEILDSKVDDATLEI